ncbi:HAD family hydrolase [[Clostridium] fimetarium]|uniref:Phosphoglycolate phosphatase n=1 Tax=[Clostridium] fimetarium TaxID=99656 RepID=A0A1I0MX18_9FIRM|nr:HAD family hydrolase [[Clostridium] fimetarium]SEV92947.1 phosphoglycolate phosphatase [[Clostridium] fimetarium]
MKYDGIIFDLDGTLWDSTEGICSTWNQVLSNYPDIKTEITVQRLYSCMGLLMEEIAEKLFPQLDKKMQLKLLQECCDLENIYLAKHGGILYPRLEETIVKLAETHKLFIVSNCQDGYIQSFFTAHKLGKYFTDFESAGKTGHSKGENNKLVISRNHLKSAIYVGDTLGDANSAIDAKIPFVFARYGFGDVKKYDFVIDDFHEILKLEL